MAKNNNLVLLGYDDEGITAKHAAQVDFTTNKLGGEADYPYCTAKVNQHIACSLCKLPCRLVVQIYAPLESSSDHRTLYVFACINSTCWNRQESWTCLRVQVENRHTDAQEDKENASSKMKLSSTDWCSEADDWGDDDNNANLDEENCNLINNSGDKISEDEESSSYDDSVRSGFLNLSIDEKNANNGAQAGAVARLYPPTATAEIEADENGEVVTVETPTSPKSNLEALLQGGTPDVSHISSQACFIPHFMSVFPEEENTAIGPMLDNHVKELLSDYHKKEADFLSRSGQAKGDGRGSDKDVEMAGEDYERSRPLHGDKMFHQFLTRIKANPEQVLRYNREGLPLLMQPLQEQIGLCKYCKKELVFEFQLIPTLIPKLRLSCDSSHCNMLDFGTVLIYTCRDSCWGPNDSFKEETVIVQREVF